MHLRTLDCVQLVFHFGAKARTMPTLEIETPSALVKWLAKDRALFTVGVGATLPRDLVALEKFVRSWIRYV